MNKVDLNKAWDSIWNNEREGVDRDTKNMMKDTCLNVEKATNFFRSERKKEDKEAKSKVNPVNSLRR
jgi:hypothetical protein